MSQLALPLDWRQHGNPMHFVEGAANQLAARQLAHPALWPVRTAVLTGPRKCGKSLLARAFAEQTGAILIDDAPDHDDTMLFHAWNSAQEAGRPQLFVGPEMPWDIALPDLRSRLAASPHLIIGAPDAALLGAVLRAEMDRHGIALDDDAASYFERHTDRDYVALARTVDRLVTAAAGRHWRVTRPVMRALVSDLNGYVIDR